VWVRGRPPACLNCNYSVEVSAHDRHLDRLRDHRLRDRAVHLGQAAGDRGLRGLRARALGHGVLTIQQSLAGFGDPATIFVASLFVISAGMERSGVTAWVGQVLIDKSGDSRVAAHRVHDARGRDPEALISVNGAVAALLPVVVVLAVRLGRSPSAASHAARLRRALRVDAAADRHARERPDLGRAQDAGGAGFGYFEFAMAGIPLVIGGIVISVLLGEKLLPARTSKTLPSDLSRHAHTLVEQYRLTSTCSGFGCREDSPLVGTDRTGLDLSARERAGARLGPGGDERRGREGRGGRRARDAAR
jgi:hypothetical protein